MNKYLAEFIGIGIKIAFFLAAFYCTDPGHGCRAQSIESISPTSGYSGDEVIIRVNAHGTHFLTWNHNALYFELVQGTTHLQYPWIYNYINDTTADVTITLTHSKPLGYYDFVMHYNYWDPYPITLINPGAFMIDPDPTPPQIVSLSPDSSVAGKVVTTFITTINSHFDYWNNFSYLVLGPDTIQAWDVQYWLPGIMKVRYVIPFTVSGGLYDVHLGNTWVDGDIILANGFEITATTDRPSLVSCAPDTVQRGGDITLQVTGLHTAFNQFPEYGFFYVHAGLRKSDDHSINTYLNQYIYTTCLGFTETLLQIQMNIDYLLPVGTYDVFTVDPLCDSLFLPGGLTITEGPNPPSIESLTPDSLFATDSLGNFNGGQYMLVKGRNTHFNTCTHLYVVGENGISLPQNYGHYYSDTCFDFFMSDIYRFEPGWYDFYFGSLVENLVLVHAFYVDNPVFGVEEKSSEKFRLYPNPSTGKVFFESIQPLNQPAELTITNNNGIIVYHSAIRKGNSTCIIDLAGQPKGVYYVRWTTLKTTYTQKLILL